MSCTMKSSAASHTCSFSLAGILHRLKNEPSLCWCKELDDEGWYVVLDLALHLLLCYRTWVVSCSTSCQIMFYQWIAWHTSHISCIVWTLAVIGMYKMKLIPYWTSSMFIFWKNNFVTFDKRLFFVSLKIPLQTENSINYNRLHTQSQPTITDWTHNLNRL